MAKSAPNIFLRRSVIKEIFLHQLSDAKELFEIVAKERGILPILVEKDYWIMHCLWGLQQQEFKFALKGGTSLSKGFDIIERFSEDIDMQIYPKEDEKIWMEKNHDKPKHISSRSRFFNNITQQLNIPHTFCRRDFSFDDKKRMRSAGIRTEYFSLFAAVPALKEGIVLELGFDKVTPNLPCDITSWAFEKAREFNLSITDNRAKQVLCYCPEYTFIEKLQTISTKYRLQQEQKTMPTNFLRHYYDVYKLLENDRVLKFLGSEEYHSHKADRFRSKDEKNIRENPAFSIQDSQVRRLYTKEFQEKSALYFGNQPTFEGILQRIARYYNQL